MFFPVEVVFDIFQKVIVSNNDPGGFVNVALLNRQFAQISRDFALQQLVMDTYMDNKRDPKCVWLYNFPPTENVRKKEYLSKLHSRYTEIFHQVEEDEFEVKKCMLEKLDFLISHSQNNLTKDYIPFQATPLSAEEGYYTFFPNPYGHEYILKEVERGKYITVGSVDSLKRFSSTFHKPDIFPKFGVEIQPLSEEEEKKMLEIAGFYKEKEQIVSAHRLKTENYYFLPEHNFVVHVNPEKEKTIVFGIYKKGKFYPCLTSVEMEQALCIGLSFSMYPHMENIVDDLKKLHHRSLKQKNR